MAKTEKAKSKPAAPADAPTTPAPVTGSSSTAPKSASEAIEQRSVAPRKNPRQTVIAKLTTAPRAKAQKKNGETPNAAPAAAFKTSKPSTGLNQAPKPARKASARSLNYEEVALRAYFISERRRSEGIPGEAHLDWLEAERQIQSETATKKSAGSGARKARV